MKLKLSTSNVINGGTSIVRRPASEKSNVELVNGLRSNFAASKEASRPSEDADVTLVNGQTTTKSHTIPYTLWTTMENDSLNVPSNDPQATGLAEERSEYDLTVKLFLLPKTLLPNWRRHLQEAMATVLQELSVDSIDLLIVSFPGVTFDADSEDAGGCASNKIQATESELFDAILDVWQEVEKLQVKGVAAKTGIAEFGRERLQEFLPKTSRRPAVNQINVRDACVVPESIMQFAKQEGLELLTHNDCTNILPRGTLRDLLGDGPNGAGVLAGPDSGGNGLRGDLRPEWVVKYTAVVRDRGVIEHKGYFASAELSQGAAS
ncbi:MAG: hypothetical protein L6R40_006942 [Gallowayella cf. fulva]|nr:MAG: hypothetical protein L6R40_006942 [Xanthomendoza cf. fulva]